MEGEDLVRELLDRAHALVAMRARVRRPARDRESEAAEPLARRLEVPVRRRRLDDERRCRSLRSRLEVCAAGRAAHLLVRGQEHAERTAPLAGVLDRFEQHDEAGLHVVDARPVREVALDPERHRGQRSDRPDRVGVADQQERRSGAAELGADVVAVEERYGRAQRLELAAHPLGDLADAGRVRRRLDLDELAQQLDHPAHFTGRSSSIARVRRRSRSARRPRSASPSASAAARSRSASSQSSGQAAHRTRAAISRLPLRRSS